MALIIMSVIKMVRTVFASCGDDDEPFLAADVQGGTLFDSECA